MYNLYIAIEMAARLGSVARDSEMFQMAKSVSAG